MSAHDAIPLPQAAATAGQPLAADAALPPSAFWPAFWMAIAFIACKAAMLTSVNWWTADSLRGRADWLVLAAHEDILLALGVGVLGQLALWLARRWPGTTSIVWHSFLGLSFILVMYGVASVILFEYLSTPLTYSLLYLAGDMKNMRSSAGAAIGISTIALVAGVPLAYLLLVRLTSRLRFRRTWLARAVLTAGLLGILATAFRAHQRASTLFTLRWEVTRNPHAVLVASVLSELFGGRSIVLGHDYPPEYEADFHPIGDGPAAQPTPGLQRGRKNVIVVICESLAAQHMAIYGGKWPTTPNLLKEAPHSLIFDGFYAHVANTANSLTAITLSTYVPMSWREVPVERPDIPGVTVPKILSQFGYRTAFISAGDNQWSNQERFLQGRGFQTIWDYRRTGRQTTWEFSWGVEDRYMVDMLLQWIDQEPGRPFCAYTWTQGTHHPYYAGPGHKPIDFFASDPARPHNDWDLGNYLNAMHELDAQLGRLFDSLRQRGLADDTVVLIMGDHGEAFGWPRKHYGHTGRIYQEDVHVPLILWSPGLFKDAPRSKAVGGHVDISPTIMDLLGLPADASWQGRSLLSPGRANRAYSFGCTGQYLLGVRQDRWKYMLNATHGREELYDIEADPNELTNRANDHPDLCRELRQRIAAWVGYQQRHLAP